MTEQRAHKFEIHAPTANQADLMRKVFPDADVFVPSSKIEEARIEGVAAGKRRWRNGFIWGLWGGFTLQIIIRIVTGAGI